MQQSPHTEVRTSGSKGETLGRWFISNHICRQCGNIVRRAKREHLPRNPLNKACECAKFARVMPRTLGVSSCARALNTWLRRAVMSPCQNHVATVGPLTTSDLVGQTCACRARDTCSFYTVAQPSVAHSHCVASWRYTSMRTPASEQRSGRIKHHKAQPRSRYTTGTVAYSHGRSHIRIWTSGKQHLVARNPPRSVCSI